MKDEQFLIDNGVNIHNSLEIFGDIKTYNETLVVFLNEVESKLNKITNYKAIADMANYAILVHSLKSDAMYFGFDKLYALSYKHEMESKQNNIYFVSDNFEVLNNEAKRIINVVKVYLGLQETVEEAPTETTQLSSAILVVDDSDVITNYVLRVFNKDYQVLVANDGDEAIEFIKDNNNIVMMLLDLHMPKVDGFVVLDYFKDQDLFKKIPVAIITSNELHEIDTRAEQYPVFGIVKKPFNELNIKNVVNEALTYKGENE